MKELKAFKDRLDRLLNEMEAEEFQLCADWERSMSIIQNGDHESVKVHAKLEPHVFSEMMALRNKINAWRELSGMMWEWIVKDGDPAEWEGDRDD